MRVTKPANGPDRTCCPLPETICDMTRLNIVVHQAKQRTCVLLQCVSTLLKHKRTKPFCDHLSSNKSADSFSLSLKENNYMNNNSVIKQVLKGE